jgi:hypothetical protein
MNDAIRQWTSKLSDQDAGWVIRRDAAEKLGQIAEKSITSLLSHRNDSDQDVQKEITDALKHLKDLTQNADVIKSSHTPSLEKLVTALKKTGSREIVAVDAGFDITVTFKEGRSQKVHVSSNKSPSGNDLVQVTSICGEATEKVHTWALRSNTQFSHCALAIKTIESIPTLIMINSFLAEELSLRQLKASVKEIAYYGDWVESKLGEEDLN